MKYTADVVREGRWWMVSVPEIDGLTQARRLGEAELMARELVAVTTGQELEDVSVEVTVREVGGIDVAARIEKIEHERRESERLKRDASIETEVLARELVDHDVPMRDVGALLGVSYQRVHQLVSS